LTWIILNGILVVTRAQAVDCGSAGCGGRSMLCALATRTPGLHP